MPDRPNRRPNIIVIGHKQHGKDTVAEYLRDRYDVSFAGSSWFMCERVLFDKYRGRFGYPTPQACYDDRDNHRALWFADIAAYNHPDAARLGREILAEHDIYCGLRNDVEFDALRQALAIDLVVWIDAARRKPLEPASSMKLTAAHADVIIDNNGPEEALYAALDDLYVTRIEPLLPEPNWCEEFTLPRVCWGALAIGDTLLIDNKRSGIQEHRVIADGVPHPEPQHFRSLVLRNLASWESSQFTAKVTDRFYRVRHGGHRKLVNESVFADEEAAS